MKIRSLSPLLLSALLSCSSNNTEIPLPEKFISSMMINGKKHDVRSAALIEEKEDGKDKIGIIISCNLDDNALKSIVSGNEVSKDDYDFLLSFVVNKEDMNKTIDLKDVKDNNISFFTGLYAEIPQLYSISLENGIPSILYFENSESIEGPFLLKIKSGVVEFKYERDKLIFILNITTEEDHNLVIEYWDKPLLINKNNAN